VPSKPAAVEATATPTGTRVPHRDSLLIDGGWRAAASGETFDAAIPAFSLDIPRTKRVLH